MNIKPNPNKQIKQFKKIIKHFEKQIEQIKIENFINKKNIIEECIKLHCELTDSSYTIDEYSEKDMKLKITLKEKPIYKNEETGLDIYFKIKDEYLIVSVDICQPYKYWERTPDLFKCIRIDDTDDCILGKVNKILKKIESHMQSRIQRKEYQECKWKIV